MVSLPSSSLRSLRRCRKFIGRTPLGAGTTKLQPPRFWKGSRRYSQRQFSVVVANKLRHANKRGYHRTLSQVNSSAKTNIELLQEYGPLGRPIMTEPLLLEILKSSPDAKSLSKLSNLVQLSDDASALPVFLSSSPKLIWNQYRDQFGFEPPQYRHEIIHKRHKVTMLTVLPNPRDPSCNYYDALRDHNHVGSHPDYDWIEMVAVGISSTKQRAGQLAALDQIQLWKEASGIDLTLPPESWPIGASNADNLTNVRQEEANPDLDLLHSTSQTLLGLLRCSPIRYDFDFVPASQSQKPYWTAEAETYWNENYYFSTAIKTRGVDEEVPYFRARSKKEAQKHALVALLEQNEDTPLGEAANSYRSLLDSAPRIAALRIPYWKEDLVNELRSSLHAWERWIADSSNDNSENWNSYEINQTTQNSSTIQNRTFTASMTELRKKEKEKVDFYSKKYPDKYQEIQKSRENLPIATLRHDLTDALKTSNIVLVQAGTGSGKSTQVPQYILEEAFSSQTAASTRILVTQPRRIAAKSLAERVSYERFEGHNNKTNIHTKNRSVGYSVRFDSTKPRKEGGSIEFVTTGILLKRLLNGERGLEGISHILIDEVHERDLNTDILLVLMRDLLIRRREQPEESSIPKLVLLSATLDISALTDYFAPTLLEEQDSIPVLSLPSKPLHPVETLYLEDIVYNKTQSGQDYSVKLRELGASLLESNDAVLKQELENLENDPEERANNTDRIAILQKSVSLREKCQEAHSQESQETNPMTPNEARSTMVGLVSELALHLSHIEVAKNEKGGSILCFLPGMSEIKECMNLLHQGDCSKLTILPLYSDLPHNEQQKVFNPCKPGRVKVILSTNIAESSVTIDDVLAVIDSGLVKESAFDATSSTTKLETVMSSKASSIQRLGRVGRVSSGTCYRLYSKGDFEAMMEKATPEIQKSNLGGSCLQVASMLEGQRTPTFQDVKAFLRNSMDPPCDDPIEVAINELTSIGAMTQTQEITSLGKLLVRLPLDPSIGKILVMGASMNCLGPLLTAAAWFGENQVVFSSTSLAETRDSNRFFSETSDIEGIVRSYDAFWHVQSLEGWKAARQWAREHSVHPSAMVAMKKIRTQLLEELVYAGLVDSAEVTTRGELRENAISNQHGDCKLLVSALWMVNLAARNRLGAFGTLVTSSEEVARLHPSSVLFHKRPPNDSDEMIPDWYSFRRKVQTSSVFLRGCSSVLPEQILLFGGSHLDRTSTSNSNSNIRGILDGWITIEGDKDVVDLLIRLRTLSEAVLMRRLFNPNQSCNDVVDGIRSFLDKLETGRIPEPEPRAPSDDFLDYFLEDDEIQ